MVLESLTSAKMAEKRPIELLPLGFLFGSIAIFLSLWVFPSNSSLAMVFFTVMAALPLMMHVIGLEKEKEECCHSEMEALHAHEKALPFFVFIFLGLLLAYSVWFVVLPTDTVSHLFSAQTHTIKQINVYISGSSIGPGHLTAILSNNIKVLTFCVLFSFIYGAGAIFILTWNASVIGAAVGNTVREVLSKIAVASGLGSAAGYFHAFSLGLLRYLVHGIPEILGYFFGGLAGGMISVAMVKHEFGSEKFTMTMRDALALILVAAICLVLAAVLEVGVTPMIPIR
ncbi:MAG: stage II sporulation protein M [Candidatus Woesearchaeota archaeon]|nr:MAG: stage II sporulation protein M [Candidatus Woesearchaeota archaeon]